MTSTGSEANQMVVWPGKFSVRLPRDWSFVEEDGLVTCCNESAGVGAVQITVFKRATSKRPTASECLSFAKQFAAKSQWLVRDESVEVAEFGSSFRSSFEFRNNQDFWKVVHVAGDARIALLTYNCSLGDEATELSSREVVMSSFEWDHADVVLQ